jgi:ribosomal protein S27AE
MGSIRQDKEDIHQAKETKELIHKVCYDNDNPKLWIELADLYANAGYKGYAMIYYREAIKRLEAKCPSLELGGEAMKEKKKEETISIYNCPACGGNSFIEEGLANYKDSVKISTGRSGMTVEGGSPELDVIKSTIKCVKCGKEVT